MAYRSHTEKRFKNPYKKIKLLELKLRRKTQDMFSGGYHSAFKGHGMIFSDYRQYVPGDDIRAISWPLTAKMGEPYIKLFEEEKGATFIIAMDISGSFDFGSHSFKGESACEVASIIALSAQKNHSAVGLLLFSDRVELYIPPARGPRVGFQIARALYSFKRQSRKTDIVPALDFLNSRLKKSCHIFLFTDFLHSSHLRGEARPLKILGKKHEVVACLVQDPLEKQFPPLGLMELQDIETGKKQVVDTSSFVVQKALKKHAQKQEQKLKILLKKSAVEAFAVQTDKDSFNQLLLFLKKR